MATVIVLLLLAIYSPQSFAADDIVLAEFETTYGDWQATGDAFGSKPATGTLDGQQEVTGFHGQGLVNTFLNKDASQGTLTSPPILIQRKFLSFL
ncbi:MAG: hypothetical protein KDA87_23115, partial [Planctomycetales bacterium]|nr:hypothetical protein [Planctomycetales bacterium]